jgi:hypothetical protein
VLLRPISRRPAHPVSCHAPTGPVDTAMRAHISGREGACSTCHLARARLGGEFMIARPKPYVYGLPLWLVCNNGDAVVKKKGGMGRRPARINALTLTLAPRNHARAKEQGVARSIPGQRCLRRTAAPTSCDGTRNTPRAPRAPQGTPPRGSSEGVELIDAATRKPCQD